MGDVEQRGAPVRLVEHPQERELVGGGIGAAEVAVQPALAELRLALGKEVHVRAIVLQHLDDVEQRRERSLELLRADQVEVVRRRVILGELALVRAREAADRVRTIVRDLRVFSRREDEEKAPIDVCAVLESSVRMGWSEIRHRAQLVREYGEVPPVLANESRLGQVFLNLLVNAAQAIPEGNAGGNVIRIRVHRDGDMVVVAISDSGTGMEPETLKNLFTPFFTTKAPGEGTGLGLTITARIVQELGGTVDADNREQGGARFTVRLPEAGEAEP